MVVLGENPLYRMGRFDPGDLFVQSAVGIDEAVVVDAQLMKNGGIEVADMDRVLHDVVAVVIGLAVVARLEPSARNPGRVGLFAGALDFEVAQLVVGGPRRRTNGG